MKFIKVSKILDSDNQVFIPAGSPNIFYNYGQQTAVYSQAQQNQMAQQQMNMYPQQSLNQSVYVNPKPIDTLECYLSIDSINYLINNNNSTIIYLNNNQTFYIKETPEQVMKLIHDQDFNKKMDNLLNE